MANLLGILVGATVDRKDGGSGVGGAIKGSLIEGAVKLVAPVVVTFAVGLAVQYGLRRVLDTSGDS